MRLPLYQVDAFTGELFGGNPAAVCPLERWLPDADMQAIAAENNRPKPLSLSATATLTRCAGLRRVSKSIYAGTPRWRQAL